MFQKSVLQSTTNNTTTVTTVYVMRFKVFVFLKKINILLMGFFENYLEPMAEPWRKYPADIFSQAVGIHE